MFYHLRNRMRTHTKEKPFQCGFCQKIFFTAKLFEYPYEVARQKEIIYHYGICQKGYTHRHNLGKSILQVLDRPTGTRVLDNTRPFVCSSIVSFWVTPARPEERTYHFFKQYWYTKNVPVFTSGTFQYLGLITLVPQFEKPYILLPGIRARYRSFLHTL